MLESGEPVIIERNGRRVRISAEDVPSRLDALVRRPEIVVWLYTGETEQLSARAIAALEENQPVVSPMVQLELTYLHEIDRLIVADALVAGTALVTKDRATHDQTAVALW